MLESTNISLACEARRQQHLTGTAKFESCERQTGTLQVQVCLQLRVRILDSDTPRRRPSMVSKT